MSLEGKIALVTGAGGMHGIGRAIAIGLARIGKEFPGCNRSTARNPMYNVYKCKDGKWIAVGGLFDDLWTNFCEVIGREDLTKKYL